MSLGFATTYASPSPNNNDDEEDEDEYDDDYYNDENNFGGRQKIGKSNGKTPGNNQAQNKQFRDATRHLAKDIQAKIHKNISKTGASYHDIVEEAKNFALLIFLNKLIASWEEE